MNQALRDLLESRRSSIFVAQDWAKMRQGQAQMLQAPWGEVVMGEMTELVSPLGAGKTEAVLDFLQNYFSREHDQEKGAAPPLVWVECGFNLFAWAFAQRGIDLARMIFLDLPLTAKDLESFLVRTCGELLQSQAFGGVILSLPKPFEQSVSLRKLQVASEKSNGFLILLSEQPTRECAWAIRSRVEVYRNSIGELEYQVLKSSAVSPFEKRRKES